MYMLLETNNKMSVSKYTKRVVTWRAYPRVFYFYRRYSDLVPRFHRVIAAFPASFQEKDLLSSIDDIEDTFSKGLDVHVVGCQDLDLSHIVLSTKALQIQSWSVTTEQAELSVNICFLYLEKLDEDGHKKLEEVFQYFDSVVAKGNSKCYDSTFIVIDIEKSSSDEIQDEFRNTAAQKFAERFSSKDVDHSDRIIFGSQGSALGSKISEYFETKLVNGFHEVLSYLERFVRKSNQCIVEEMNILNENAIVLIRSLLRDYHGIEDMKKTATKEKSDETEGLSIDEKVLHQFLKKLAQVVKCSIVEPSSMKYSLSPWICNLLLVEIDIEHKTIESVSKNTRYHLSKFLASCMDESLKQLKSKNEMKKFDYIVYSLRSDISQAVSDAEKTLASANSIAVVMVKLIFEIEGYLEQTIIEKYEPRKVPPSMPRDLRNAILKIDIVNAVATVYSNIEIHVIDDSSTDDLKEEVQALMRKHEFRYPFRVKHVTKQLLRLMANMQHEHGKQIQSPFPDDITKYRQGTLGAFVQAEDNTLYCLTCAHVVCNPNADVHDVFIQERGLRLKKFGICQSQFTINTGTTTTPLIDIAAVKINEDFVRHCILRMKDDEGINRSAIIAQEMPSQLLKTYVYKHGGTSGFTQGIICSTDIAVFGADSEDYLIMVESLPADENGQFARGGDSGAVICAPVVDSGDIKVVGMLSGGNYKVDGEDTQEKYLSFLLKTGLQKLQDSSNVSLNVA